MQIDRLPPKSILPIDNWGRSVVIGKYASLAHGRLQGHCRPPAGRCALFLTPQPEKVIVQVHYAALNPADPTWPSASTPPNPGCLISSGAMDWGRWSRWAAGLKMFARETAGPAAQRDGHQPAGDVRSARGRAGENLVEIPAGWTEPEAAGATLVYLTAYQALTMWGPLPPAAGAGDGGVGRGGRRRGATCGGHGISRGALAQPGEEPPSGALGAAVTFNPEDPKWGLAPKNILGPRRVDLAVDNIGGRLLPQVISPSAIWAG